MKTKLYIVRHGTTKWNEERRMQGWTDTPLSETGIRQAEELAQQLQHETIHGIYSSSLQRAAQTASLIAKHHTIRVILEDDLREGRFGIFEGMIWEEVNKLYSKRYPLPGEAGRFSLRVEGGGESIEDIYQRVSRLVDGIVKKHPSQTIMLVSHGLAIKCIAYHFGIVERDSIERLKIGNAEHYIVEYSHRDKAFNPIHFPLEFYND
ncbi:histidine phosphatase family protein [Candidatus Roizmanbacteria bacterium]|nr:histidine phosphatase family protein [Candidatus Roizmanbacteria bacterium]